MGLLDDVLAAQNQKMTIAQQEQAAGLPMADQALIKDSIGPAMMLKDLSDDQIAAAWPTVYDSLAEQHPNITQYASRDVPPSQEDIRMAIPEGARNIPVMPSNLESMLEAEGVEPAPVEEKGQIARPTSRRRTPDEAFHTKMAEGDARRLTKAYEDVNNSARSAQDRSLEIKKAREILKRSPDIFGFGARGQKTLRSMGVAAEKMGLTLGIDVADDEKLSDAEAMDRFTTSFTLDFTEKTKGAISDKEMLMFQRAAPGLSRSVEGNKKLLRMMEIINARTQERARFFRRYREAHDGDPRGVEEAWDRYINDNPVLGDL